MNIPQEIISELSDAGIHINENPISLCENHGRHVCFVSEPGSSIIVTGIIIGCELEISGQGYNFKIEIDKKQLLMRNSCIFNTMEMSGWL